MEFSIGLDGKCDAIEVAEDDALRRCEITAQTGTSPRGDGSSLPDEIDDRSGRPSFLARPQLSSFLLTKMPVRPKTVILMCIKSNSESSLKKGFSDTTDKPFIPSTLGSGDFPLVADF